MVSRVRERSPLEMAVRQLSALRFVRIVPRFWSNSGLVNREFVVILTTQSSAASEHVARFVWIIISTVYCFIIFGLPKRNHHSSKSSLSIAQISFNLVCFRALVWLGKESLESVILAFFLSRFAHPKI